MVVNVFEHQLISEGLTNTLKNFAQQLIEDATTGEEISVKKDDIVSLTQLLNFKSSLSKKLAVLSSKLTGLCANAGF